MDADQAIADVAGCGAFQVLVTGTIFLIRVPALWVMMMMAFGGYNPGWTCLDRDNTTQSLFQRLNTSLPSGSRDGLHLYNNSTALPASQVSAAVDQCADVYKQCSNIWFRPGARTVVSEWGLICDKAWIPPSIISLQMIGSAIGTTISGQLADRYGRKTSLYIWIALSVVASLVTVFSVSWQMFAVVLFFLGLSSGGNMALSPIYPLEFANGKWRGRIVAMPAYCFTLLGLGLFFAFLKDWRHLYLANAIISVLCFLTIFWLPESIRWLLVKRKEERLTNLVAKMFRYNKTNTNGETPEHLLSLATSRKLGCNTSVSLRDLFSAEHRKKIILLSVFTFCMMINVFGISFGIGSLFGDFYMNFIMYGILPTPMYIFGPLLSNKIGRRTIFILCEIMIMVSCVVILILNSTLEEDTGGLITTCLALFVSCCYGLINTVFNTYAAELFPTSLRAMAFSTALFVGRIGCVLSPYVFPKGDGRFVFAFSFIGATTLLCLCCNIALPETYRYTKRNSLHVMVIDNGSAEQNQAADAEKQ